MAFVQRKVISGYYWFFFLSFCFGVCDAALGFGGQSLFGVDLCDSIDTLETRARSQAAADTEMRLYTPAFYAQVVEAGRYWTQNRPRFLPDQIPPRTGMGAGAIIWDTMSKGGRRPGGRLRNYIPARGCAWGPI